MIVTSQLCTSLTEKEMIGRRLAILSFSFSVKEVVFLSQDKEWEETRKEMGEREIERERRRKVDFSVCHRT